MNGLFITATDTGAGKTTVAAAIVRELRRRGHPVRVCKPVATGAVGLSDDTRILAEAAGRSEEPAVITPWLFAEPAAPPVAARLQGVTLSLDAITQAVRQRADDQHALVVEGVGGLLCPLTDQETVADLAVELRLPLIIVARRGLGTLNHTLLTVEAAQRRNLTIAGVVVNETEPVRGLAAETNVGELRRRLDVPVLAVMPYQGNGAALAEVDWWRLCGGE
jgi:dethiobiotin synthetase